MTRTNTAKRFAYGTHRLRAPEETLATISPHFRRMGLTRIADVTGLDCIGIPVCMAVRPNAQSLSVFQGKGLTLALAKVSAAMEAIESYHAENFAPEIVTASYTELAKQTAVCQPRQLNLRPNTVYHDDMPVAWVKGYDLIQQRDTFVPYDLVHLQFLRAKTAVLPTFFTGSNGLASGNHRLEAISHALCEIIERDAIALWELSRMEPEHDTTIVDVATIDSQPCQALIAKFQAAGLDVYICNQTSDIGIPAYGCVISDRQTSGLVHRRGSSGGYGCHLSKEVALLRALTEAAQSRLTHISGARDDMYRNSYLIQQQSATNHESWNRILEKSQAVFDFSAAPSLETDTLEEDVALQIELLKAAGFEQAVMVDLTDPHMQIPVVKMIIPTAEYKHPGLHKRFGERAKEYTLRALVRHKFSRQTV